MRFSTLPEWLDFLQSLHAQPINLGLERVRHVLTKLGITSFHCPVVTVAGTNGKGSTVRGLEAIFHRAKYRVATFTSPPLFSYNEQIRINEKPLDDLSICKAFDVIAQVEGCELLTPFEFQTIAALYIFSTAPLDVIVLEVGLGGRLDAVNAIDADIAVITSISLDHTEWLGNTRHAIAFEKAGIMRTGKPAVIGETDIPESIEQVASERGAILYRQNVEFSFKRHDLDWEWRSANKSLIALPQPSLSLQNMSTVLMVTTLLSDSLPVSDEVIREVLADVTLPGRIQVVRDPITCIFDVSHNPASVALLAQYLRDHPISGKTFAVFSMFADKDISESIASIHQTIDEWWIAPLQDKRAATLEKMSTILSKQDALFHQTESIKTAYHLVRDRSGMSDRIVVFGSFHTVKEALQ